MVPSSVFHMTSSYKTGIMETKLAKKANLGLAECEKKNPNKGGYGKEVKIENALFFQISPIFL